MDYDRTLNSISYGLKEVAEEEEEEIKEEGETSECSSSPPKYPPMPHQPETPREPMEFLCRSWSISTSEISIALSSHKQHSKNPNFPQLDVITSPAPAPQPPSPPPPLTGKLASVVHARGTGTIGKWFHHREFIGGGRVSAVKKRDTARLENAHLHSAVSIASLATAIAAVTASGKQDGITGSKMSSALASASELLASHCVELAELTGAGHDRVVSAVRSAVDVRGPGGLLTLTAAAATALRGEAALRARLSKEAKNSAAISPYERALPETHDCSSELDSASTTDEQISAQEVQDSSLACCTGELMQCTRNGVLQWKHIKVCINKKSQVVVEIKSKHVGGAFSMKSKGIVNDVCETTVSGLQNGNETESAEEELYFGISTGKGLIKFKCKNKADKQKWVDSIRNLLHRVTAVEVTNTSHETEECPGVPPRLLPG